MVLDGKEVVAKNYVTFPDNLYNNDEQVQPNGVDLRIHRLVHVSGRAELPVEGRLGAKDVQINEIPLKDGWFDASHMTGNYLADFRESISVPDGYCAIIIPRSSLVRVGCEVLSGLWDTGFEGRLGASLRIRNPIRFQYGARLAQVIFYKSAFNGHRYAGGYQGTTQSEFRINGT